jgi:hypothetical protein
MTKDATFFNPTLLPDEAFCANYEKENLATAKDMWEHAERVIQDQIDAGTMSTKIGQVVKEAHALFDEQVVRMYALSDPESEATVRDVYYRSQMEQLLREVAIYSGETDWTEQEEEEDDEVDAIGYLDRHLAAEIGKYITLMTEREQQGSQNEPASVTMAKKGKQVPKIIPMPPRTATLMLDMNADALMRQYRMQRRRSQTASRNPTVRALEESYISQVWSAISNITMDVKNSLIGNLLSMIWSIIFPPLFDLPLVRQMMELYCTNVYGIEAKESLKDDTKGDEEVQKQTRLRNYETLARNYPKTDEFMRFIVITVQELLHFWVGCVTVLLIEHIQTGLAAEIVPESETTWTGRVKRMADDLIEYKPIASNFNAVNEKMTELRDPTNPQPIPDELNKSYNTLLASIGELNAKFNTKYGTQLKPNEILDIPDIKDSTDVSNAILSAFGHSKNVQDGMKWTKSTLGVFKSKLGPRPGSTAYKIGLATLLFAGYFFYNTTPLMAGMTAAGLGNLDLINPASSVFWKAFIAYRVRKAAFETISGLGNYIFGITVGGSASVKGEMVPLSNAETAAVIIRQYSAPNTDPAQLDRAAGYAIEHTNDANNGHVNYLLRTGTFRMVSNLAWLTIGGLMLYNGMLAFRDFGIDTSRLDFASLYSADSNQTNLAPGYLNVWIMMAANVAMFSQGAGIFTTLATNQALSWLTTNPTFASAITATEGVLGYNFNQALITMGTVGLGAVVVYMLVRVISRIQTFQIGPNVRRGMQSLYKFVRLFIVMFIIVNYVVGIFV